MGIVIYMIATFSGHICGIKKKQTSIYNCRNGKYDHENTLPGAQQNKCKKNGRDCSGCSQAAVIIIVPVFEICRDIRNDQCADIKCQVIPFLQTQFPLIMILP